jgi:hypothetical protein
LAGQPAEICVIYILPKNYSAADKTNYDLMRATFPAGTVSGAPKIRAMQIISELEGTTRGPYADGGGTSTSWWGERPREPARQETRPTKPAAAG